MSSPIHRALFSPPTSPGAGGSPIFEAVRGFLSPALSGDNRGDHFLSPSPKPSASSNIASSSHVEEDLVAQFGPGGFNSTRAYPSRLTKSPRPRTPEPISIPTFNIDDSATRVTLSTASFNGAESPNLKQRTSISHPIDLEALNRSGPSPFAGATRSPLISLRALGVDRSVSRALVILLLVLGSAAMIYGRSGMGLDMTGFSSTEMLGDKESSNGIDMSRVTVKSTSGAPKLLNYHKPDKVPAVAHPKTQQRPSTAPLTPSRELLALQAYLLADTSHVLPAEVPLDEPLDSMIILDFKASDESSWQELEDEVDPVVVWTIGKTWNEPILDLLEIYAILPTAKVLPLDSRSDLASIQRTLSRLIPTRPMNARELPLITIGGKPIATYQDLVKLHNTGELHSMLEAAGAVVDGQKAVADEEASRRSRGRPLKHVKARSYRD